MKKKKMFLLIIPILIFIIIVVFLLTNKQNNWIDNILKQDYQIYTLECDGTTKVLDKKVLKEIKKYFKELSDNGPFLGNLDTCYKKIIIDYNSSIADIEIIDDSSIILKESNTKDYYTYYTNASKLITHLNKYFNQYIILKRGN